MLVLGLDNAGKTTFLEKLKSEYSDSKKSLPPERIAPTVGQNVGYITFEKTHLRLWDLGGQENLRTLWESYYNDAHGIVFVVDSSDRKRLEECKRALEIIITNEDVEGLPILMLANKQDREDRLEVEDIKEIFNKIAERMSARDSRVLPISALSGDGLKDAVEWLTTRLVRNKQNRPPTLK